MSTSNVVLLPIANVQNTPYSSFVSRPALEARVKRALNKQDEHLRKSRWNTRTYFELGEYYVIDICTGGVRYSNIDLEDLARELGVMHDLEKFADD